MPAGSRRSASSVASSRACFGRRPPSEPEDDDEEEERDRGAHPTGPEADVVVEADEPEPADEEQQGPGADEGDAVAAETEE